MNTTIQQKGRLARLPRVSVFATVLNWFCNRWNSYRSNQAVSGLSDHMLRDIGIDPFSLRNRYEARYRVDLIDGTVTKITNSGGRKDA